MRHSFKSLTLYPIELGGRTLHIGWLVDTSTLFLCNFIYKIKEPEETSIARIVLLLLSIHSAMTSNVLSTLPRITRRFDSGISSISMKIGDHVTVRIDTGLSASTVQPHSLVLRGMPASSSFEMYYSTISSPSRAPRSVSRSPWLQWHF